MVVSIYVSEIPKQLEKDDLLNLFKEFQGFIDLRVKTYQDRGKICFVDFEKETDAKVVISSLNGIKYSQNHKGFNIKISDNTKGSKVGKDKEQGSARRSRSRSRSPIRRKRSNSNNHYNNYNDYNPHDIEKGRQDKHERYEKNERADKIEKHDRADKYKSTQSSTQDNTIIQSLLNNIISNNQPNNSQLTNTLLNLISTQQHQNQQSQPQHSQSHSSGSDIKHRLNYYDDKFRDLIFYGKNATNIVFIEGLPNDCSEREVAHIFRPFPGFISSRLIEREKNGEKSLICFCDFEEIYQATECIFTLQGYRFSKNDLVGLHLSYGVNKHKQSKNN